MTVEPTISPPHRPMSPAAAAFLGLILLTILVLVGINVHYRAVQSPAMRTDYLCFHLVWQAALTGGDIYGVADPRGWKVHYPPGMAALLSPMGFLSFEHGVIVWYILSAAALVWSCGRLVVMCDEIAGRPVGPIVVVAALVCTGPIVSCLQRGQFSVLLTALMIEALWQYRRNRSLWAGVMLGIGASIKGYPALAMWPLVVRRDWPAIMGFMLTAIVVTVALPALVMGPAHGLDTVWRFGTEKLLPLLGNPQATQLDTFADLDHYSPTNQSAYAVFARFLCADAAGRHTLGAWSLANLPTSVARTASLALGVALMLIVAVLALRKGERTSLREALLWSLPMLAANFISTVAWHHYYSTLVLTYALVGVAILLPQWRPYRAALTISLLVAVLLHWVHFVSTAPLEDRYFRKVGLLFGGSLVLWLVIAYACARMSRSEQTAPGAISSSA